VSVGAWIPGPKTGDPHSTAPKYADLDVINPSSVMLSGITMFEFMSWKEAAALIEKGITGAVAQKKVTYDLHRQMEGATKVKTSEFATAIIENMA
jgi:isocitrate dehydrogenase